MSIIDRNSKKKEQNLWETFLSEATLGNSFRDSHVLFLGPRNTGKRTLINSIFQNVIAESNNNNKVGSKGQTSALEYTYIRIKNPEDPENDDYVSKMNVWILDDPVMHDLLWHCIREDTIENMMICICLDMTEPWNSLSTLSEWMSIISEKITRVLRDMPLYKQDALREKLAKYVKTYELPKFDEEGKLIIPKRVNENPDEEEIDIPLPEGVLKINFGVPIMILGTKADGLEVLEKEKDGDYKLDFLQYSLRNFGLPYAATLLYLSLKQNINLDILYDYILHRSYGFGLKYNAEVIHKDSIFIPSGYDKPKIINETFQKIKQGDIFEEVISQPAFKKAMNKDEVSADETQAFLAKLKIKIQTPADGQAPDPSRQSNGPSNKELARAPSMNQGQGETKPTATSTLGFFEKLKGNPTENANKPPGEGTPSHARVVSQQIPATTTPPTTLTDASASRGTIDPNNTKTKRAEKLFELLKKKDK